MKTLILVLFISELAFALSTLDGWIPDGWIPDGNWFSRSLLKRSSQQSQSQSQSSDGLSDTLHQYNCIHEILVIIVFNVYIVNIKINQ